MREREREMERASKTMNVTFAEDVKESNGEVCIHFDGWTDRYDYWTKPDHKDLHPIGFMKQRASNHKQWNQELQKPKCKTIQIYSTYIIRVF